MSVTLADVERATAARLGPYARHTATGGSLSTVEIAALKTTITLGGYVNLWLLRRGYKTDGTPVLGFDQGDRQRRVKAWNQADGTLEPDWAWTNAPVDGEDIEVMHLDPAQQLRPAVIAGIRRCRFRDRVKVTLSGTASERNLSAALPWLTDPSQIVGLSFQPVGSLYGPDPVAWQKPFERAGSVWVEIAPDPYPNVLYVIANRPAYTLVNGVTSDTGPTDDLDELPIPLEYAAAAGHIEAWRIAKPMLQAAAQSGLYPSQKDAAAAYEKWSKKKAKRPPGEVRFSRPTPYVVRV